MTFGTPWTISGIGMKNSTVNGSAYPYMEERELGDPELLDPDAPTNLMDALLDGDDPPEDEYHGND